MAIKYSRYYNYRQGVNMDPSETDHESEVLASEAPNTPVIRMVGLI